MARYAVRVQLPWPAPLLSSVHRRPLGSLVGAPRWLNLSALPGIVPGARGYTRGGGAVLAAAAAAVALASDDAGTTGEQHGAGAPAWATLGLLGPVLAGGSGAGPRHRPGDGGGRVDAAPAPASGRSSAAPDAGVSPEDFVKDLSLDLTLGTVAGFCAGYALKKVCFAPASGMLWADGLM